MNTEHTQEFDKPYKMNIIKKAMIGTHILFDLLNHNQLDEIDHLLDYKLPKRIIQATDHFNNSILMALLLQGHLKLAGKLITYFDEYIIYDQINDNQNNALHICCQKNSFVNQYKYQALIDFLIKKLPSSLTMHNDALKTPFFYSVENLDLHTFEVLNSLKVDNYLQKDIFSYNIFHAYYQHFTQLHSLIYQTDNKGKPSIYSFDNVEQDIITLFNHLMHHTELLFQVDEQKLTPFTYALKHIANEIYQKENVIRDKNKKQKIINIDNIDTINNHSTDDVQILTDKQQTAHDHFVSIFENQMVCIMAHIEKEISKMTYNTFFEHFNSHHFHTMAHQDNNHVALHNMNKDDFIKGALLSEEKETEVQSIKQRFLLNEEQLLYMTKIVNEIALLKDAYMKHYTHQFQKHQNHIEENIYEIFHTTLLTFMATPYYQTHRLKKTTTNHHVDKMSNNMIEEYD